MEYIFDYFTLDMKNIIIIIIFAIFFWLLIRDIKCWYYRINEIIDEQKKQTEILNTILTKINSLSDEKKDGE